VYINEFQKFAPSEILNSTPKSYIIKKGVWLYVRRYKNKLP